jgi:hypothetical protein
MLGFMKVKQNERKNVATALVMLRVSQAAEEASMSIDTWLCRNIIDWTPSSLETFFSDHKRVRSTLSCAPADDVLQACQPRDTPQDIKGQRDLNVPRAIPFTLNEFGRLCMIIIDDEVVRRGLLATACGTDRAMIDRNVSRHDI